MPDATRLSPLAILAAVFLFLAGCASAGSTGARSTSTLTAEELVDSGAPTLYEAVERLRPRWLGRGGAGSGPQVVVYRDRTRMGGPSALKDYRVNSVVELRYLDSTQASLQLSDLGSQRVRGAIIMVTESK